MPGYRVGDEAADLAVAGIECQKRQGHVLIAQQRRRIPRADQPETGLFGLGHPADELVLAVGFAGNSKSRHLAFTPGVGLRFELLRQCAPIIKPTEAGEPTGDRLARHEYGTATPDRYARTGTQQGYCRTDRGHAACRPGRRGRQAGIRGNARWRARGLPSHQRRRDAGVSLLESRKGAARPTGRPVPACPRTAPVGGARGHPAGRRSPGSSGGAGIGRRNIGNRGPDACARMDAPHLGGRPLEPSSPRRAAAGRRLRIRGPSPRHRRAAGGLCGADSPAPARRHGGVGRIGRPSCAGPRRLGGAPPWSPACRPPGRRCARS